MATEIDELKEMVRRNTVLAEDTNRQVHALKRAVWWGRLWRVLWWAGLAAISGYFYYTYAWPYFQQLLHFYDQAQQGVDQAQTLQQQVAQYIQNLLHQASSTPQR